MTLDEQVRRARGRIERAVEQTLAAIDETETRLAAGGALTGDPITSGILTLRDMLIVYSQAARGRARAERLVEPTGAPSVAARFPLKGRGRGESLQPKA